MVEERRVTRETVTTTPAPVYAPPAAYVTPAVYPAAPATAVVSETVTRRTSGAELLRRVVVFVFALIQADIVLRLILLLIGASRGNAIVDFIYTTSSWFVGPFEGILQTNAIGRGGSVLDVAGIVALIGWTILELVILAAVNIARRED